jgi:phage-related minor tail protein
MLDLTGSLNGKVLGITANRLRRDLSHLTDNSISEGLFQPATVSVLMAQNSTALSQRDELGRVALTAHAACTAWARKLDATWRPINNAPHFEFYSGLNPGAKRV